MIEHDLIVIGAGPAGMAAARTAADGGASVRVLDEQPAAGGQIYRGVLGIDARRSEILGPDYEAGRPLVEALEHPQIQYERGAVVWRVEREGRVAWTNDGAARMAMAARVLVATGAVERPIPIPGWTLPGVMTAGAAQILLKTAGVIPNNAVLAGAGPLIYLIAQQLIDAGAPPKGLGGNAGHGRLLSRVPSSAPGFAWLEATSEGNIKCWRRSAAPACPATPPPKDCARSAMARSRALHFEAGGRTQ